MHWHAPARFRLVHLALLPHGEGLQGSTTSVGASAVNKHSYKSSFCNDHIDSRVVIRTQAVKASPVKPGSHRHCGTWFVTEQVAWWPHTPGHGSTQCCDTQAKWRGHSALTTHSGLHSI